MDPADADSGVGQVDNDVAGLDQARKRSADGGGDLAGDHAEALITHAPGDPGGGLGVSGMAVQHAGGKVAAERHPGESVEALQLADHDASSPAPLRTSPRVI